MESDRGRTGGLHEAGWSDRAIALHVGHTDVMWPDVGPNGYMRTPTHVRPRQTTPREDCHTVLQALQKPMKSKPVVLRLQYIHMTLI